MPLVFAAIAPHGDLAIPEACRPGERRLAVATQVGMVELERRARQAAPDTVVVLTPHNVHVAGAMAVITSGRTAGSLETAPETGVLEPLALEPTPEPVALDLEIDRTLSLALLDALRDAAVPAVGVSYGGNDPREASMPLDWGALIPLWYLGGRWDPAPTVVVAAPARDLPRLMHVTAGRAIAAVAAASDRRIALVASADQAHAHDPAGPYGGHPRAREYDALVVDAVREGALERLIDLPDDLLEDAKPDSWWQMAMLHGALAADPGWSATLLSYEAPTYYGMLCAAFERV